MISQLSFFQALIVIRSLNLDNYNLFRIERKHIVISILEDNLNDQSLIELKGCLTRDPIEVPMDVRTRVNDRN